MWVDLYTGSTYTRVNTVCMFVTPFAHTGKYIIMQQICEHEVFPEGGSMGDLFEHLFTQTTRLICFG